MNQLNYFSEQTERPRHTMAFAGLLVFTLLLYMRPNEMFPEIFGTFPIARIVAVITLLFYVFGKLARGERVTIWPIELVMLAVIALLGFAHIPIAASPSESVETLFDPFLKVVTVVVLMINIIDTRARLLAILKLVVISGTVLALAAIKSYLAGEFLVAGSRIRGLVSGMFGNPNDLATALDLLLPLAVVLALTSRGFARLGYFACAALLTIGVVITFSRGGFLGLVAAASVFLWKLGRRNRFATVAAGLALAVVFMAAIPNSYAARITSMFNPEADATGSAQLRRDLLSRGVDLASRHLIVGVSMGNYHIYSLQEQVAHNSYLEISAELGATALLAYLVIIFSPLRSLRRIQKEKEKETAARPKQKDNSFGRASPRLPADESYYLSIALQATLVAYIVCSFFSSIQYLWYVYYPVAYAISLRRIVSGEVRELEPERKSEPIETLSASPAPVVSATRGVLWKPQREGGALNP